MKKIALFLAVIFLAASFASAALAATDDFVAVDFRSKKAVKTVASYTTSGLSDEEFVDGGFQFTTTNTDPWISLSFKSKQRFNAADFPVYRIDYKIIEGTPSQGQFFFATTTDGFTMGSVGTYTEYAIDNTTSDYQSAIIDLELINGSQWTDEVKTARLDVVTVSDVKMAVRFAGFFRNEKEALAFDYDKWASENPVDAASDTKSESTATTTPATDATVSDSTATADSATTETSAPQTADPFTAVAVVMAVSAGAALTFKKKR